MLDQNDNLPQADGQSPNESIHEKIDSNVNEVFSQIENSPEEENEEEIVQNDIPVKNYETMSLEDLVSELDHLITEYPVNSIKNHVEEIRKSFTNQFTQFLDEKREEYSNENTGDSEGFEYHSPIKNKFDALVNKYRERKNAHYNKLQNQLKENLRTRENLLNELKEVIDTETSQTLIKKVNDIRERWKTAGAIPKDKYNHVWNNFHFHIERFYEHLNMDREMRDLEYKNNLEQKLKIIDKAKELLSEKDILKSLRELQTLHKIWKEEIGPVSKEKREEVWSEFSEITKVLHDKREQYFVEIKNKELVNLSKRKAIVAKIISITKEPITKHGDWQTQIQRIEVLRDAFINAGRVPNEHNDAIWADFKDAIRKFNASKNSFYKNIKKEQQENLNKKIALVNKAKEHMNSVDFQNTTPLMKKIQEDWKKIGHVPRKYSDAIWADFRNACNHYFDNLTRHNSELNAAENDIFEKKKQYLEQIKTFKLVGDHKEDLAEIKKHIENWKQLGKLSLNKRHVEIKFNKILDGLFDQLSLSKKDTELEKFNAKIDQITLNKDSRALTNELIVVQRKIEELQNEIFQLENNIQFITNAKNDNPLIKEINKNIDKHKDELEIWKEKQANLRKIEF